MTKYLCFAFMLLLYAEKGVAQNSIFDGWNIGAKIGGSRMIGEFPYDFSGAITEFDYNIGLAFDAELSKFLSEHWEVGFDINHTNLNGEVENPSFSAEGHHPSFDDLLNKPVEFDNKLLGQKFFFRYYFKNVSEGSDGFHMNPFIRGGVGFLRYNSRVKYVDADDDDLIFGKGQDKYYLELSTAVFTLGTGFKTTLSQKFYLLASLDFNAVGYDFLDVVHNYEENGDRLNLLGVYTEFKIGIFYNITGYKPGKGRSQKSAIQQYLPFGR